jgi:transcriptional regulator with XRE-family HTH domain
MTNERLRAAIASAGLNTQSLSERIGVDPKTVERWIAKERVPHRTHRLAVSAALGKDEIYLWPAAEADARSRSASQAEFVAIYPTRGGISPHIWSTLLANAKESVDLLAFAASFLHDAVADFDNQLIDRAKQGVQVRLLFGDPHAEAVQLRGEEEGIGDLVAARCRLTWNYFDGAIGQQGVLARTHGCTLYNSIFRFDDTILANSHQFGAAAAQSPVIHVQRIPGGRLFSNYMQAFEKTWQHGRDVSGSDLA